MDMLIVVFWVVVACRLTGGFQRFKEMLVNHLQDYPEDHIQQGWIILIPCLPDIYLCAYPKLAQYSVLGMNDLKYKSALLT
jgi:hypothetical protein